MVRWVLGVLLASVCDVVFGLDGRADAPGADSAPDAQELCPADYRTSGLGTSTYLVELPSMTWAAAHDACRDDSITQITHLVVFDGVEELAAVRSMVTSELGTPQWVVWSGYARNRNDSPAEFYAVTGEPLSPMSSLWEMGEPNNSGTGEPVVSFGGTEMLFDREPLWMVSYVCECDGKPATRTFQVE